MVTVTTKRTSALDASRQQCRREDGINLPRGFIDPRWTMIHVPWTLALGWRSSTPSSTVSDWDLFHSFLSILNNNNMAQQDPDLSFKGEFTCPLHSKLTLVQSSTSSRASAACMACGTATMSGTGASDDRFYIRVRLLTCRRHCSNKLHRLRQVTGLTSGKGKVYKKPAPVTLESVKDVK
jgi:hypothetical protein